LPNQEEKVACHCAREWARLTSNEIGSKSNESKVLESGAKFSFSGWPL
jgi:hypothetical protein